MLARVAPSPDPDASAASSLHAYTEGRYSTRYQDDSVTIYGFVRAEDTAEERSTGYGVGGGVLPGYDPRQRMLPRGTCLFDPETGEEIGVIRVDRPAPTWRAEDGAGYLVEIGTRWGTIEVNVEPGDGAVGPDWPARWRQCQGSP